MFTRPDEVCLVVELYRGGSVLLPGYPAYLVDPANAGAALQTHIHLFIHLLSDTL